MTRILNGCAEARTVGTHYSTTHPPPLRQNSISFSSPGLPSPLSAPSVPLLFLSLSLSPLSAKLSSALSPLLLSRVPGPFLHPLAAGSSRSRHLGSPSPRPVPLSRAHPALTVKLFLCNRVYVCAAYTRSIFFSSHLSFHLFPLSLSSSLSPSFFVKHNPRV